MPVTASRATLARVRELEIARRLPADGCSLDDARRYTGGLARHHYENFRVASWLLPRRFHQAFYDVYSYCRWADDLGDEVGDAAASLELLDWWERELDRALVRQARHPVFIALAETIADFGLPAEPFRDLLRAFRQDQTVRCYADWEGLLDYCRYSASPVGRLVLAMGGYRDPERTRLSDLTCTALQLANCWQDVARDYAKGRIYIPLDLLSSRGLSEQDIGAGRFDHRYRELMRDLVARTRRLFEGGLPLAERVSPEWRIDIELFSRGGMAVIDAIEAAGYDTLTRRPVVRRSTQMRLLGRALAGRWLGGGAGRSERAA
ncbi:MAG TPA: squalene synthase HpnC [Candidatus Dormibacteraeota bacterium]|nr:squalene synthase HpnC [Candidatus Dormibacteraeota bacterium]